MNQPPQELHLPVRAGGPRRARRIVAGMVAALSPVQWSLVALALALTGYALAVGLLVALGRRGDARALAGFIPDCVVLVGRLAADPRVPRRAKLLLALLTGYLALAVRPRARLHPRRRSAR